MITLYKYRIYCNTNSQWEYQFDTIAPSICPINASHTVNTSSVSILDQISAISITNADSPYSVTQKSLICNTTSGSIILNLPKANRCINMGFVFKKTSAPNTITITPNGSQLIDGLSTKILSSLNETAFIQSNGIGWTTISYYSLAILDETNNLNISTRNKGDMFIDNGKEMIPLSIGNNNNILLAKPGKTQGVEWSTLNHTFLANGGTNTHAQIDQHIATSSNIHGITSDSVGTTDIQTLTNKTITSATNTVRTTQMGTTSSDIILTDAVAPTSGNFLVTATPTTVLWQTKTPIPGGSITQVQYNSNNGLEGASNITIDTDGTPIIGEFSSTNPNIPSIGSKIFSRNKGGRRMATQFGPSGVDYSFQPFIATNKIGIWSPYGNGTIISIINFNNTATGTATTRNVASTNLFTSMRRIGYVSANPAGSSAGTRHGAQQFWMGNAVGLGGFFYLARFGSATATQSQRIFVGLYASSSVIGNVDPSTLVNILGFGADTADLNFTFMHNDGTGTATKDTLTGNVSAKTSNADMFEIRIFCAPNGTTIYYSIENLSNASYYAGSTSSDIPSNTTLLSPQIWINNAGNSGTVGIDVVLQYIETDN